MILTWIWVNLLDPCSTAAQPQCSSLMDHIVQEWFFYAGWPPAASHHYSSSISPPRLCLWVSVVHKCVCLCFVQNVGFPTLKNPATCVNHTVFVWWSSARGPHGNSDVTHTETSIWTTPMLDDKQIIRDEIQVPILVDDCLGSLQTVSLWLDDVGHTTGG